jgi:LCP family protein required for cell wall assembly
MSSGPPGPSGDGRGRTRRTVAGLANSRRLAALGAAIDEKAGVKHKNKVPRAARTGWRRHQWWWIAGVSLIVLVALLFGGGYLYANWRFSQIKKFANPYEVTPVGNQPFNILEIGSDSRAGLTGFVAQQTGASTGSVSGQRSDVIKIMHVDPVKRSITVLSIPRDTIVTLLANQNLYGRFNRLNVNFENGAGLLTHTITADFGIPIAHTVVVDFAGIINAADSIGGAYLNFPYPARDKKSDLNVPHAGCQLVTGFQALALVRSRYYEWYEGGKWREDVTSDYGRIYRQNEFIKAVVDKAKGLYNPLTINRLLSDLPQGIALDNRFSFGELLGLVTKFHNLDPTKLNTYTLPTAPGSYGNLGSILFVQEPAMQNMLAQIFGNQLVKPTNPPPVNSAGATPSWSIPTTTTTVKTASVVIPSSNSFLVNMAASVATTTTTVAPEGDQYFDPTPCTPK